MFGASLLDEYEHCIVDMGLGWNEVAQLARNSFQHSSLPVRNRRLFLLLHRFATTKPNIYQDRLGTKHRPTWRKRRRRFYAGE
jgi:hypothetical protein